MNLFYKRLGFWLMSVLLMSNIGISQNNLSLQLTESSVLLDRLVVCGDLDFQRVIFSINGENLSARQEVKATLSLFDGVVFDGLGVASSTAGIVLDESSTRERPVFILPDLRLDGLTTIEIGFTVTANCDLVNVLSNNNEIQVFDTWEVEYTLDGTPFLENFNGVEYRNTIAIPNLSLETQPLGTAISLNVPFEQQVKVVNSGLNSYLDGFTYSFTAGEGVTFQSLMIGDRTVFFEKEGLANGDTILTALITNDFFDINTIESGLLGNGDNRFDVDEIVTLTASLAITNCDTENIADLLSTHGVSWGCVDSPCQRETITSPINLGIGEEQVQFSVGTDTILPSFCGTGTTSIIVSNNGFEFDDGFGAIFDIATGIGFINGEQFGLKEGGYEITSFQIGDVVLLELDSVINLSTSDFFLEDPDGEGGLSDADGDGYFDDLPVGEQFMVTASYQIDCTVSADFDLLNTCDNDFRASFDGKMLYRNSCGGVTQKNFDNYFRSFNSGGTQEICSDPDVFNNNDEFTFVYSGERRRSNFAICNGEDEIRARLILPEGVQVSEKTFLEQDSFLYEPTITINGEEWLITFDAATFNQNKDYNLNLVFRTECAVTGFTSYPVQIEYLCSECDCAQLWYCGILEGTWVHDSGPPCESETCEVGLAVNSFEVERTTFGYTDNTFTTPIDLSTANKEVALTCDSVRMAVSTTVGQTSLSDSIGLIITYGNADESTSNAETFLFSDGMVTILRTDGTQTECIIAKEQIQVDTSNSTKQIDIDLSSCLEGGTLVEGDQLSFVGNFSISADAPAPINIFRKIPEFRVRAYTTIDGVFYDNCETFGSLFRIAKLETRFSGPSNNTYPTGCEDASMIYSLDKSINANAMRSFFGEEHRQAARIDRVRLNYDPALLTAFSDVAVDYRVQQGDWIPLPDFAQTTIGEYELNLSDAITTITGSNQLFQLRLNLVPECSSSFSSANSDGFYSFSTNLSYNDLHYADEIGDGSCARQRSTLENRSISYQSPPTFSLQAIESNIIATGNEFEWMIEYCNTSFNADAGLSWVAFEVPSDSIELISVEVISQAGDTEFLLLQEYGTTGNQFFSIAPSLKRNIEGNTNDDICNLYKITARSRACSNQTVLASTGWNCTDFDQSTWTPDDYAPCQEQVVELTVTTSQPFLSADYLAESSIINGFLCDTSTIDLIVRNEEGGAIFDVTTRITVPVGTRLVRNSFEFAYPSTHPFVAIESDPILLETDPINGNTYEYANFAPLHAFLDRNGLAGFNVSAPDSSEFRLKYLLVTDCDFNDGSVNRYRFQGLNSCGEPSNTALAETPPFIFEANPNTSRKFEIELVGEPVVSSNNSSTLEMLITNVGNNVAVADSITLTFPTTIDYVPSSTVALSGIEWEIGEPIILRTDSTLELRYPLPVGLESGEEVNLSLQIIGSNLSCQNTIGINIATISTEDFFCEVSEANCLFNYISNDGTDFSLACNQSECDQSVVVRDTILVPNGEDFVNYCLDNISIRDINQIPITDNGEVVDISTITTCNIQQICLISYGNLLNVNDALVVESWEVDGVSFSGTVANIAALVDMMNVWDPTGNWTINENSLVFEGGHINGVYSPMNIFAPALDTRFVLGYDTRTIANGTAIPLTSGLHIIAIPRDDACADSIMVEVVESEEIDNCATPVVQRLIIENSVCGQSTGSATLLVAGNLEDYLFEWIPSTGTQGAINNIRTDLIAGGYTIKIRRTIDTTCFVEQSLVIKNNDGPSASFSNTPSSCSGSDGTVTFTPNNFTYIWSDGETGATRTDLRKGIYFVTFTDPNDPDCPNVELVEIEEQNDLTAILLVEEYPDCNESNGAVQILVEGGSGNYRFDFPSGNNRQTGLGPGIYRVAITDVESGCELTYPFLLESRVTLDTLTITNITDIGCLENGRVDFNVQYSNDFLQPADTIISNGFSTFTNGELPVGDYFIYVEDITGCITTSGSFTINPPTNQLITIIKPSNCDTTQFITIDVSDTDQNLSYDWADIPGTDNEANRTNLESGLYELTITDEQNCTTPISITLPECCVPPEVEDILLTNASCGRSDGRMEIVLSEQNVQEYTFRLTPNEGDNNVTPNVFENLPSEGYELTISYRGDSLCEETLIVLLEEDSLANIITSQIQPASCGNEDGQVTLTIVGNDEVFTYSYLPNFGMVGNSNNIQQNLPAGQYQVSVAVEGEEQCVQQLEITVPQAESNDLGVTTNITPVSCAGNGQIEIVVDGNITDYVFSITPAEGDNTTAINIYENLPAGTYQVTAILRDSPECLQTIEATVGMEELDNVGLAATVIPASCLENARIVLAVNGSVENYNFSIEPAAGTMENAPNVYEDLPIGIYQVTATLIDNTSCNQTIEVEVTEEGANDIGLTATANPVSCANNGRIEIVVTGDPENYTYALNPAVGTNTTADNVFEDLPAGTYEVTATLTNNPQCFQTIEIEVEPEELGNAGLTATATPVTCSGNGQIELAVDGAIEDFLFSIEPSANIESTAPNLFTEVPTGFYQVTATSANNPLCTQTIDVEVRQDTLDSVIATPTPVTCSGNGQIKVSVSGAIENYTFSITPSEGVTQSTPTLFENLSAGMYQITALNTNENCTQTIEVEVQEEGTDNVGLTATTTPVTCFEAGSILLEVNGNIDDFTFSIVPEIITLDTANEETSNIFENIRAGEYTVTASLQGVENCSQTIDVTVATALETEFVEESIVESASCLNETGRVELQMLTSPQNFIYSFTPNVGVIENNPNSRDSLPPGAYQVVVTAIANQTCSQTIDFVIDSLSSENFVSNIVTVNADCGTPNGIATIQVEGAVSDFEFIWQEGVGNIGESPDQRIDLAVGNYLVTVRNTVSGCSEEVPVTISRSEITSVPIISDAVQNPSCGETNGRVLLTTAEDPSNYIFNWTPNIGVFDSTENIRTNLPSGDYRIEIIDRRDTICSSSVNLRLEDMRPSAAAITSSPACNTIPDGRVVFSPDVYRYTWEDGFVGGERNDLLAGTYTITITDTTTTNICESTMDIELMALNNLTATIAIDQQPSCSNDDGAATITVSEGSGDYTYSWSSNAAMNTELSAGMQTVTITDTANGCEAILEFTLENPTQNSSCEDCILQVGRETITVKASTCASITPVCLEYDLGAESSNILFLNGEAINKEDLPTCELDSIIIYAFSNLAGQGIIGPYQLTSWPVDEENFTGTFNNIIELTALMNQLNPIGEWRISEDGLSIVGKDNDLTYQAMQISTDDNLFTTTLEVETRLQEGRISLLPIGAHEVIILDTQRFCSDTLLFIVTCAAIEILDFDFEIEDTDTLCFPTNELPGDSITLTIECLENEVVTAEVFEDNCVIITGANSGRDTACVILCDEMGICDTNIIAIQIPVDTFEDSILIGQTQEICITDDLVNIDGRFISINELSDSLSGAISYEIDELTGCIRYTGEMLGTDSTSFSFCTEDQVCDTIPFVIQVMNNMPDRINDTLFINETIEYCFDTSIFPGEIISFENSCSDQTGNNVEFSLNTTSFCVEYKGLEIGRDSACIVLCDNMGNCDTAFFGVIVIEFGELPIAVDDIDTAIINDPKVINILKNDVPFGVFVEDIRIIDEPLYGDALPTLDGSITYTSEEFCARFDEFTYEICNNIGCDTATVKVWIECIDIVIFSAVSPNRDMVNDFFFVSGIEEFPNNRLQIYNRWGERVYDTVGYNNTWDGTWEGDLELPDGSYFYCLELNDDAKRVFRGYVEIHR